MLRVFYRKNIMFFHSYRVYVSFWRARKRWLHPSLHELHRWIIWGLRSHYLGCWSWRRNRILLYMLIVRAFNFLNLDSRLLIWSLCVPLLLGCVIYQLRTSNRFILVPRSVLLNLHFLVVIHLKSCSCLYRASWIPKFREDAFVVFVNRSEFTLPILFGVGLCHQHSSL